VRDGKGEKDRVTLLPESLVEPLKQHLERVRAEHERALREGGKPMATARWLSKRPRSRLRLAVKRIAVHQVPKLFFTRFFVFGIASVYNRSRQLQQSFTHCWATSPGEPVPDSQWGLVGLDRDRACAW
jgi:hypothetical protein